MSDAFDRRVNNIFHSMPPIPILLRSAILIITLASAIDANASSWRLVHSSEATNLTSGRAYQIYREVDINSIEKYGEHIQYQARTSSTSWGTLKTDTIEKIVINCQSSKRGQLMDLRMYSAYPDTLPGDELRSVCQYAEQKKIITSDEAGPNGLTRSKVVSMTPSIHDQPEITASTSRKDAPSDSDFIAGKSQASAANSQPETIAPLDQEEIPAPIAAFIVKDSFAYKTSTDLCSRNTGPALIAGRSVVVVAERECLSRYTSEPVKFYQLAVNGKHLYVEKPAIKLSTPDQERLKKLATESRVQYFNNVVALSFQLREKELRPLYDAIDATSKAGLTIINASIFDVSEHTEGTSFSIKVGNPTSKPIKYIWFTVVGFNAVNDPVSDPIKGSPSVTVKAIGPIEKNKLGTYKWEYMWHTDIVEFFKITEIKVQYMDKTVRTIRDWKSILLSPQNRQILEEYD